MGVVELSEALDLVVLIAEVAPERLDGMAVAGSRGSRTSGYSPFESVALFLVGVAAATSPAVLLTLLAVGASLAVATWLAGRF
jgi:hypothetical protein